MCLITKKSARIVTSRKDMIVYKMLFKNLMSPIMNYRYLLNQLYQSDIVESDSRATAPDSVVVKYLLKYYDYKSILCDLLFENNLIGYSKGFHSYLNVDRAKKVLYVDYFSDEDYYIFKCIIPKGSKYVKGFTDLIVSNQIIIKEQI